MEIYRFGGKRVEDITVDELVDVLRYCREDSELPGKYQDILIDGDENTLKEGLVSLGLIDDSIRTTDLGLKVLEHYDRVRRTPFPVSFAKKMTELRIAAEGR